MSETEKHRGKLIRVETESTEAEMERILFDKGLKTIPSYHDTIQEFFRDECHETHLYHEESDTLWMIEDEELDPYGELNEFMGDENEIEYLVEFYNGGTWFGEVLEEGVTGVMEK